MVVLKETTGAKNGEDKEWDFRYSAVAALGKLKLAKEQIPALVEIIGDEKENSQMRRNAVDALVHSREAAQTAWASLMQLIRDDPQDDLLIFRVVIALREIDPPANADRVALARELRMTFDQILQNNPNDSVAKEMEKTVKAVEKNKRP
jgi:HEAT repeat protein